MLRDKTDIELSSREAKLYVKLASEATDVASASDFKVWAETSIRKLFPHEMLISGVAQRKGEQVAVDRLLSAGFPMRFVEAVTARRGTFACPTLKAWFRQGRPQIYQPALSCSYSKAGHSAREFETYDLKNVAAHGVPDLSRAFATYFSFSQIPQALNKRHADLLKLLVPHLHHAYIGATSPAAALPRPRLPDPHYAQTTSGSQDSQALDWAQNFHLTAREREILYWLGQGKTNEQISQSVHRARDTVKHQVSQILTKLNAHTRNDAVALAVRVGLLPERRALRPVFEPQKLKA